MMKINLVAVGRLKDSFYRAAADEYLKRLSRFAAVRETECPEGVDRGKATEAEAEEGEILKRLKGHAEEGEILKRLKGHVVLLDISGEQMGSEEFSDYIATLASGGSSEISFVIGGSRGVTDRVRAAADKRLSFGKMTFPHTLMRVMLLEQIYRAFTAGMPYHK